MNTEDLTNIAKLKALWDAADSDSRREFEKWAFDGKPASPAEDEKELDFIPIFEPVKRANKDAIRAISELSGETEIGTTQARFLVDLYYTIQKPRVRVGNQLSALSRDEKKGMPKEPRGLLDWLFAQQKNLEQIIRTGLGNYIGTHEMCWFFMQTYGIGDVLAAGLVANISIDRAPAAGNIFRFAGLAPGVTWEKGKKRPWNASLRTICWKVGDSFRKFHNREECYYGKVYEQRKAWEQERNDAKEYKDQAEEKLKKFNIRKETAAYKAYSIGMLPPAHIDARSARYAVKLFLSHLHWRWYETRYNKSPPDPYPVAILGHKEIIEPPQIKP